MAENRFFLEGTYGCRVVGQQLTKNQRTDNYQVVIRFQPEFLVDASGEPQPLNEEAIQRSLYLAVTERAAQITVDKLADLGLVFDRWGQIDENAEDCVSLIGLPVELECRHDTYEGKTREKWDVPRRYIEPESVEESEAAELDALYGDIKPSAGRGPDEADKKPSKVKKSRGGAAAGSGDDLAF